MTTLKTLYGATGAVTITANSLASSGTVGRASTAVDNSSNLFVDVLVTPTLGIGNSAPANDKTFYVFVYGSWNGSNYPEGITGTDASYTIAGSAGALTTSLRSIGFPAVQNVTQDYEPFSVASFFGGVVPTKWGLVLLNYSGQALASSAMAFNWAGIQYSNV